MDIHLDLVGGLAGDMFIAALLDAFPRHESAVLHSISSVLVAPAVGCRLESHRDAVLQGRRFQVMRSAPGEPHEHATWKSIRDRLVRSSLAAGIQTHALAIFSLLAEAEAFVHGVDVDDVTFHEVGAWDSLADVIGAATLIDALAVERWSASPAPLGSGRIRTAHGMLPVPAPATARLLLGMVTCDDGVGGERVTPTGAAILRHLCPPYAGSRGLQPATARRLIATGTGFGLRTLPGMSNHVRALCFEAESRHLPDALQRSIEVLEFEVDDQSGEDLAAGIERLRCHDAVLDVTQSAVFGKKGRIMMHVRVLAKPSMIDRSVEACFRETTTIGLRHRTVSGIGLTRRMVETRIDDRLMRVKVVDRPGGPTAKTEADDVLAQADHAARATMRLRAETAVLSGERATTDPLVELDA